MDDDFRHTIAAIGKGETSHDLRMFRCFGFFCISCILYSIQNHQTFTGAASFWVGFSRGI